MKAYRSKSRLAMDLLAAMQNGAPVGVSRLLQVANLTHAKLQEMLSSFEERGWVAAEREGERVQWRLTQKGSAVLAELRRIDAVMEDHGLGL